VVAAAALKHQSAAVRRRRTNRLEIIMDKSVLAEALLQSAGDAIIATDREGIITLWNAGATRIFGHGANEAVGQSLDLIIPENQRARHWAGYHEVMRTGQSRYAEGAMLAVPARRKEGTRISIEFTIVPLKDVSGTMQGMVAVLRDVTARFEELRDLRKRLAASQV
jgi:PAS domain S-box-containing protein